VAKADLIKQSSQQLVKHIKELGQSLQDELNEKICLERKIQQKKQTHYVVDRRVQATPAR